MQLLEQQQDQAPQNVEEEVKVVREEEQEIQVRPKHRPQPKHQLHCDLKSSKLCSENSPVSAASVQNMQQLVLPRAVDQIADIKGK